MIRTSLLCIFAASAMAQMPGRVIMSGSGTLKSGVTIRFQSMLASTGAPTDHVGHGLGEGGIVDGIDTIHRFMVDHHNGTYFGYDLTVIPSGAANTFVASFHPPSHVAGMLGSSSLRLLALPKYPAPQIVHDGDTIAVDLMASADGKQTLTDYLEILAHEPEPLAAFTTDEPRDFTLDDGPVKFDATSMTVWQQGQRYSGTVGFTGKPGATLWVAFPGQGRYVLSLVPHEGFIPSGVVRDNVVNFQGYEIRFMSPIAGAGKAWKLYVMHDSAYTPAPNQRDLVSVGTDRLENLVGRL
jgi:hypothetical protein